MGNLIPQNLLNQISNLYETERSINSTCHYSWFWYIIEISKEDKHTCYGYVMGFESELGYFSLKKLESIKKISLLLTLLRKSRVSF